LSSKIEKFSGEGTQPPPDGTPRRRLWRLDPRAYGSLLLAPPALDLGAYGALAAGASAPAWRSTLKFFPPPLMDRLQQQELK